MPVHNADIARHLRRDRRPARNPGRQSVPHPRLPQRRAHAGRAAARGARAAGQARTCRAARHRRGPGRQDPRDRRDRPLRAARAPAARTAAGGHRAAADSRPRSEAGQGAVPRPRGPDVEQLLPGGARRPHPRAARLRRKDRAQHPAGGRSARQPGAPLQAGGGGAVRRGAGAPILQARARRRAGRRWPAASAACARPWATSTSWSRPPPAAR